MISHFIVTSVVGVMVAICGETIAPRRTNGAVVGQEPGAVACAACEEKVAKAWVSLPA